MDSSTSCLQNKTVCFSSNMNWSNTSYLLDKRWFKFDTLQNHSLLRLQFTEVIGALCAGSLQNVTHHQKGYREQSIGHHSATLQTTVHLQLVSLVRLSRASPMFLLYSVGFTHCNLFYLSLSHFYCLTLVIVSREPHFACISWDSPEIKNFPLHVLYYVIAPFCEKLK